ncbi:MAG: VOC family protein [Gammaproteobacteria bacterium]|nr:VOC family protein [Gammaproteobacteria bacterium]
MIQPNSSFLVLIVKDLEKAKSFYFNNFGFSIAFQNEWYLHMVSESGIQVAFMLPNQPTQPEIFKKQYDGNGFILSLEVDDVDQAYSHAKNNSLDIALDLKSEEWGQRHFAIKDPNGIHVDVVQAIEPTEEYKPGYEA